MSVDDDTKGDSKEDSTEDSTDASTTALSNTAPEPARAKPRVETIADDTVHAFDRGRAIAMKSLRRWRIAAIVSLSLNVFILGIAAGGAILRPRFPGPGGPGGPGRAPPFTVRAAELALGAQVRDRVMALEQGHKKAIDDSLEELRVRAEAVDAALIAEPLDPAKLDAALEALRKANDTFQRELHLEFRDLVSGLSLDERRRLSEAGKRLGPPGKRPKRPHP